MSGPVRDVSYFQHYANHEIHEIHENLARTLGYSFGSFVCFVVFGGKWEAALSFRLGVAFSCLKKGLPLCCDLAIFPNVDLSHRDAAEKPKT